MEKHLFEPNSCFSLRVNNKPVQISEGHYIIAAAFADTSIGQLWDYDGLLIKFNLQGDTLWTKRFKQKGIINRFNFGAKLSTNELVFTGEIKINNDYQVWVMATDTNGNTIWEEDYGGMGWEGTGDIAIDEAKNIFISGASNRYSSNQTKGYLLKLDSTGNKQWEKSYGNQKDNCGIGALELTSDSAILFGHCLDTVINPGDEIYPNYIGKMNKDGKVLWRLFLNAPEAYLPHAIKEMPDSTYILAGAFVEDYPNTLYEGYVAKISQTGELFWWRHFKGTDQIVGYFLDITALDHINDLIAVGKTITDTNQSN